MKIIRFLDPHGEIRFGCELAHGTAEALSGVWPGGLARTGERLPVTKLLAPIEPRAILCIGLNYRHHAHETGQALPERPVLFMKNPASVTHPGDPIVLPRSTAAAPEVDFEVELAVIIARAAKDVAARHALDYVWGYTVGNDVSARRWQKQRGGGQWVRGKSFDTFCPLGPAVVTADELSDPQDLRLTTVLNGQLMQDASTKDMIFSVAELIAELSQDMTLLPGTVILTGTPQGVGFARKPPVFLQPGDTIACSIEGIGTLEDPVRAAAPR